MDLTYLPGATMDLRPTTWAPPDLLAWCHHGPGHPLTYLPGATMDLGTP